MIFIENKEPRVIIVGKSNLMPGINKLTKEEFEIAKDNINTFSKIGLIEVKGSMKESAKKEDGTLSSMSADEAIELVEKTFDENLLKDFAALESRKSVIKAISKQLDKLDDVLEDESEAKRNKPKSKKKSK